MIWHIDVSAVLRRSVCDLYSNLVTRPTGAAVRTEIEHEIADRRSPSLTVIDFKNVSLLDFSCADEVVAKLLIKYNRPASPCEAYFVFRGISESHMDAIEAVLERHRLAMVILDEAGQPSLIGPLAEEERIAWEAVRDRRRVAADDVFALRREPQPDIPSVLDRLHARRLLMRLEDQYVSLGEMLI